MYDWFASMKSHISKLEGVKNVDIQINETFSFDHHTQIPRISFRVIVEGGKKKKIAQIIWQHKPLGVLSVGNTAVIVKDTRGFKYRINFERVL